jgi:tRNA dimethylallyltransferase
MAAEPIAATALGDRRFDDRLRPNGRGAHDAEIARLEAVLADARRIPAETLSADDRTTLEELIAVVAGELDEAGARAETAQATRRYARRQESWFRPDPRIVWLDATAPDLLDRALTAVREADAKVSHGIPENG